MRRFVGLIAIGLTLLVTGGWAQGPEVTIPGLGTMRGSFARSWTQNRQYMDFQGVPFASPPVGAMRFQPPLPVAPWSGTLNATRRGQICVQTGIGAKRDFWDFHKISKEDLEEYASDDPEDCLYMSIYTPQTATPNLPVAVFFHGGSFVTGSSWIYDGHKFMDYDVVLVVPHYRLGPLGFLNLGNDQIAGNTGMLDQVMALEWVNQNIRYFGGDASRITVMGESAGAASSSLLAMSPLSTNLFQQYVCQSGAGVADWAIDRDNLRAAADIGKLIGCTDFSNQGLTNCFMNVDAMALAEAFDVFVDDEMEAGRSGFAGASPTIQTSGAKRFLEREPMEIMEEGSFTHKPALLGSNKNEGTLVWGRLHAGFLAPNNLLENETFLKRTFTKFLLKFFGVKDQGEAIATGVEKSYIGLENMGNLTAMTPGGIDFMGNMFLKGTTFAQAQLNARYSTTYKYTFDYPGDDTLWLFFGEPSVIPGGVCHANELILLYQIPGFTLSARDKAMATRMVQLWTNFIIHGEPNPAANPVADVPAWPAMTETEHNYMRLNEVFEAMTDYTVNEFFIAVKESFPW